VSADERKKFSLYLHPHQAADDEAMAVINSHPRKARGDLFRNALMAGLLMYKLDERLPGSLAGLLAGDVDADLVIRQISLLTGWKPSQADIDDIVASLCRTVQLGEAQEPLRTEGNTDEFEVARRKAKNIF
jgi:hypothetical protein